MWGGGAGLKPGWPGSAVVRIENPRFPSPEKAPLHSSGGSIAFFFLFCLFVFVITYPLSESAKSGRK